MPDGQRVLPHLAVLDRVDEKDLTRPGRGNPKIRPLERRIGGGTLLGEAQSVFDDSTTSRASAVGIDELRALGTFITIEGAEAMYPLKVDSLEQWSTHRKTSKQPKWLLMSVQPATETAPETAVVWVSDAYRQAFLKLFEDYVAKLTAKGNPKNQELVANIATIRTTILRDLWQSDGEPIARGNQWWELWLAGTPDTDTVLGQLASLGLSVAGRTTVFGNRTIVWAHAAWDALQVLPFTSIPLAEIRRPSFVDTIEDLPRDEQAEWVDELLTRVTPADLVAPAVCHLDTGVARTHVLLAGSLAPDDLLTVVGSTGFDVDGHGTKMAGIALYGDVEQAMLRQGSINLRHRLESVRMLPSDKRNEKPHHPLDYGTVTSQAMSTAEIAAHHRRVFCMPVTTDPDKPGDPTLWSATIDAVSVGTDIVRDGEQLQLIGAPDPDAARLVVVSAGNTDLPDTTSNFDPVALSNETGIADPAQAWNALTVGAYTNLSEEPSDPQLAGWHPVAPAGELSPHSRTSVTFSRNWPVKPDICLEGGNVLTDGTLIDPSPALLSVRTTGIVNDHTVASANATSAATAAAARLAALAMADYPSYWPETIRGLLVHAAEWTPVMRRQIEAHIGKTERAALLRRYGWGVPTEQAVLRSDRQAVTMVVQDQFQPFDGPGYLMRHFRLHSLPWPKQILQHIGEHDVTMKVTLSYFIEPNPSRRGWRRRYAYASHGLRFELKAPYETESDFIRRVNMSAANEESDDHGYQTDRPPRMPAPSAGTERWLIGPNQRNIGSLHQDLWYGSGAELAPCYQVAVYPVGGWWKNNSRPDRMNLTVRYALLVSLATAEQGVDLYTPIANELRIPIPVIVPA